MKTIFVGPSLAMAGELSDQGLEIRPPAKQGDVYRAVREGAQVIGIVDGCFEQVAPVWHKEILYALSRGVTVFGAASMGALRAVECEPFGMIGMGKVFERFRSGISFNDADVAQVHGPAELGYIAVSEALVNVCFTLEALQADGSLSIAETEQLQTVAAKMFFKERTWRRLIAASDLSPVRKGEVGDMVRRKIINQKQVDALMLLGHMRAPERLQPQPSRNWAFHRTRQWAIAEARA
jgi:hypothetical protein